VRGRSVGIRRTAVALLAAGALTLSACGGESDSEASGLDKLEFQLNFVPGGSTLHYFTGVYKGFYEDEGLDVTIRSANDPSLSVKLVSNGERKIGAVYSGDAISATSNGAGITVVRSNQNQNEFGILALADAGIDTPEDLIGKKVGVTDLAVDKAFFQAMLDNVGIDNDDVEVVNPGFGGVQQLLQGNLDATSEVTSYGPLVMEQEGRDYVFIPYRDFGAPDVTFSAIAVNNDWYEQSENKDIVERFLRALLKAQEWTEANLDEAAALFVEEFPESDKGTVMAQFEAGQVTLGDGESDLDEWQKLADLLLETGAIENEVDVNEMVTNDRLPN
jgi:NitT/TauT family transport system substrate-binding protein